MSGSAFAVTHHAFSSGAGRTSDGNGSHASTLKSPSYTKSVSWQHYPAASNETAKSFSEMNEHEKAAVVHEKANNGQSSVIHQQQAEKHRSQITQN